MHLVKIARMLFCKKTPASQQQQAFSKHKKKQRLVVSMLETEEKLVASVLAELALRKMNWPTHIQRTKSGPSSGTPIQPCVAD